jgi:hypothetical protein
MGTRGFVEKIIRKIVFIPELFLFSMCYLIYRKVDYFRYKILAKNPIIIPHIQRLRANLWYGNYFAIKNLSREISLFKDSMEHGINFSNHAGIFAAGNYLEANRFRNIYTYSEYRKSILQPYVNGANIITVGPYILGADFFLDSIKRKDIKDRYGKILLVFPNHSLKDMHSKYNRQSLIDEVIRIRHNFNSVFFCLHYLDIANNMYQDLKNLGFTIVTAGTREDIRFLRRLKDLIFLSDMTMSNAIGTHIGYSICMGKPHYLLYQPMEYVFSNTASDKLKDFQILEIAEKQTLSLEFAKIFGVFSWNITREQINLCKKYWGEFGEIPKAM